MGQRVTQGSGITITPYHVMPDDSYNFNLTNSSNVVEPSATRARQRSRSVRMPAPTATVSSSSGERPMSTASFTSGDAVMTSKIARRPL